ncbi:MAG: aminopeptidase [Spirochaetaceae bacterium]|nr:aminopeptidase [Spirochaetaceae bacterium]
MKHDNTRERRPAPSAPSAGGAAAFAAAVMATLLLCSCGPAGALRAASRPLEGALKDSAPDAGTRRFLETVRGIAAFSADKYGLGAEAAALRFLPGDRAAPCFRLTVAPPRSVEPRSVSYFSDEAKARKAAEKAGRAGDIVFLEPWGSLAPLGLAPSPLVSSDAALGYDRLAERVNYELFYAAFGKRGDAATRESFAAFAAEEATAAYLASKLTPASPLLGNYLAEKRDERTFAALFPDYRSRFKGLYGQSPPPPDLVALRDFLSETWLRDYRVNYPNRFITNKYKDFGREMPSDAELAAWRDPFAGRAAWVRRLAELGGDFPALVRRELGR